MSMKFCEEVWVALACASELGVDRLPSYRRRGRLIESVRGECDECDGCPCPHWKATKEWKKRKRSDEAQPRGARKEGPGGEEWRGPTNNSQRRKCGEKEHPSDGKRTHRAVLCKQKCGRNCEEC